MDRLQFLTDYAMEYPARSALYAFLTIQILIPILRAFFPNNSSLRHVPMPAVSTSSLSGKSRTRRQWIIYLEHPRMCQSCNVCSITDLLGLAQLLISFNSLDVIGRFGFGHDFGAGHNEDGKKIINA